MIKRMQISGDSVAVDKSLEKYIIKKIGRLDRFVPRGKRESLRAEVRLREDNEKGRPDRTCEVVLHLPDEMLTVTETTISMYAAVDIAETKLQNRLKKYKELHSSLGLHKRLLHRIKHLPYLGE